MALALTRRSYCGARIRSNLLLIDPTDGDCWDSLADGVISGMAFVGGVVTLPSGLGWLGVGAGFIGMLKAVHDSQGCKWK
jgi:hypothetical protein